MKDETTSRNERMMTNENGGWEQLKSKIMICVMFCGFFLLSGCTKEKNFVGTWEADILDQGNARDDAGELSKEAYGGFLGAFASVLADELHWNATMQINEDGTLTMNSGMEFTATWKQEGDKIIISGDNIAGTATLSDDQKTLYFNNTLSAEEPEQTNGFVFGSNSIDFEFTRKE